MRFIVDPKIASVYMAAIILGVILIMYRNANRSERELEKDSKYSRLLGLPLLIVGGLPICLYPFALYANLMSIISFSSISSLSQLRSSLDVLLIIIVTTIYPIVYLMCAYMFLKKNKSLVYPAIPFIIVLIFAMIFISDNHHDKYYNKDGSAKITNVEIYQNTPAWELASAVDNEDVDSIKRLVEENPEIIDYQDDEHGATLLLWSVGLRKVKSIEALLECGANPNIPGNELLGTPLMVATVDPWIGSDNEDLNIMKLLLDYDADPNIRILGEETIMFESGTSPLYEAVEISFAKTKTLVEGGADINIKTESGSTPSVKALRIDSVYHKSAESAKIAHYLIVENKAIVNEPYFSRNIYSHDGGVRSNYAVEDLRYWFSELDSEEYILKMEIIDEFLIQGVDYWEIPIPNRRLEWIKAIYPDEWKELILSY